MFAYHHTREPNPDKKILLTICFFTGEVYSDIEMQAVKTQMPTVK